jgi:hypothetical protein
MVPFLYLISWLVRAYYYCCSEEKNVLDVPLLGFAGPWVLVLSTYLHTYFSSGISRFC